MLLRRGRGEGDGFRSAARGRTRRRPDGSQKQIREIKKMRFADASGDGFALQQLLLNFILEKQAQRLRELQGGDD